METIRVVQLARHVVYIRYVSREKKPYIFGLVFAFRLVPARRESRAISRCSKITMQQMCVSHRA